MYGSLWEASANGGCSIGSLWEWLLEWEALSVWAMDFESGSLLSKNCFMWRTLLLHIISGWLRKFIANRDCGIGCAIARTSRVERVGRVSEWRVKGTL